MMKENARNQPKPPGPELAWWELGLVWAALVVSVATAAISANRGDDVWVAVFTTAALIFALVLLGGFTQRRWNRRRN